MSNRESIMMKPSHWLVLASAVAGSAVACALYVLRHSESPRTAGAAPSQGRSPLVASGSSVAPDGFADKAGQRERPAAANRRAQASAPHHEAEPRKIVGTPPRSGLGVVSEAQWLDRAAKVETEANHELSRMTQLLDLDSSQQDQLFAMFARRSSSWLPGMQPSRDSLGGGEAAVAGDISSEADDVMAYLNPDQQQTLIEDEMDRQAWWEEVLPQLLPPQLQDGTNLEVPSGDVDPAPDTKPFEGGEMLLEE
jgi:hypothetical protein